MIRLLLFFFITSFSIGCSSRTNDRYSTREGDLFDAVLGATAYQRLFIKKSDKVTMYSEFEPMFSAQITLLDQELRDAYVKERTRQYRLSSEEETKIAVEQIKENENFITFVLSVATREIEWNDLDLKNSVWRIILENEDATIQIDPERIELIPQKDDIMRYFYPTMSTFTKTYRVRFERKLLKEGSRAILRVTGVRGAISSEIRNQK